jgi:hypothetical protein
MLRRNGLSGYHATGDEDVDLLCRVELIRFPFVVVLPRARLDETVEIVPTGPPATRHAPVC